MKTRTTIETPCSDIKISQDDRIFTIGSCFADRIGNKLESLKYQGFYNPFGILYNPVSILKAFQAIDLNLSPDPALFCQLDGVQMHYNYHSDLSATSQEAYCDLISRKNQECKKYLKDTHTTIITLGSAFVYEHISSEQIIANCHKQAASQFNRRILSFEECRDSLNQLVELLSMTNPSIQILLTVSPIRHIRDTLVGNSRSKAILINAVHDIVEQHKACSYFPAYEIMVDDLRDYRYYEDDMLHPSSKAFDYIWDIFSQGYIQPWSQDLNKKIENLLKAVKHRSFRKNAPSHQAFIEKTLLKIQEFEKGFPQLDWINEKEKLQKSIRS